MIIIINQQFSYHNNNNNVEDGMKSSSLEEIEKGRAEYQDNNNIDDNTGKHLLKVPDISIRNMIPLLSDKIDGTITFRRFNPTLVYLSLYLMLTSLARKKNLAIARKEKDEEKPQALGPMVEEGVKSPEQKIEEFKSLQPYEIEVPDFKLYHES
jgi:hypothetical protein